MSSIDEARRLRVLADDQKIPTGRGPALFVPAVSPNHVGILSPAAGGCPVGPPHPPDWPAALPDVIGVACVLAAGDEEILPADAWELLVSGATDVHVTPLTDSCLTPFPGVTPPHLHLG
jgi:hypothetical protein